MDITGDHQDTAYECFHFERTLAILPLNNNRVSVVITWPSSVDDQVLTASKEDFSKDIEQRTDGRFGSMTLSSDLFPYPLVATFAKTFCAERFAIIGDAAVGMHPVTAHGFNLGLRGGHDLASGIKQAIGTGLDYATSTVLEKYNREHRNITRPLYHGTNALVTLYSKNTPVAKFARSTLLRLGNRLKPVKNMIMNQLTEIKSI
jgi:2-polyprenyl-6-methoxyphenol hydroxylase-like FAD-dependent oxidoreductase